ncbi:hypothetical protein BY458DRAFT_517258 [Sporodiniella umbellata]|nr:hypothetical protein BY458DRAFT_517258 [Sporodiniella umbellata]
MEDRKGYDRKDKASQRRQSKKKTTLTLKRKKTISKNTNNPSIISDYKKTETTNSKEKSSRKSKQKQKSVETYISSDTEIETQNIQNRKSSDLFKKKSFRTATSSDIEIDDSIVKEKASRKPTKKKKGSKAAIFSDIEIESLNIKKKKKSCKKEARTAASSDSEVERPTAKEKILLTKKKGSKTATSNGIDVDSLGIENKKPFKNQTAKIDSPNDNEIEHPATREKVPTKLSKTKQNSKMVTSNGAEVNTLVIREEKSIMLYKKEETPEMNTSGNIKAESTASESSSMDMFYEALAEKKNTKKATKNDNQGSIQKKKLACSKSLSTSAPLEKGPETTEKKERKKKRREAWTWRNYTEEDRQTFISLLKNGVKAIDAATDIGIKYPTAIKWKAHYNLENPPERRPVGTPLILLTEEQKKQLRLFYDEHPLASISCAIDRIPGFKEKKVKKVRVSDYLRHEASITIQCATPRLGEKVEACSQKIYNRWLKRWKNPSADYFDKSVFIDEHLYRVDIRRAREYRTRDIKLSMWSFLRRAQTYSTIAAVTSTSLIDLCIQKCDNPYKASSLEGSPSSVFDGTGNHVRFMISLLDTLDQDPAFKGCYIIMNNSPVKDIFVLDQYIFMRGYTPINLPHQPDQLNPLKQLWTDAKDRVPRKRLDDNETVESRLVQAIKEVASSRLSEYVQNSQKKFKIPDGFLKKKPFDFQY